MKEVNPLLEEAYYYYQNKKYSDAIILLEKLISTGTKDPYPYFLLSVSYLLTGQLNRIGDIIKRIKLINSNFPQLVELEAFLFLKSAADLGSALSFYLESLQKIPGDKYLTKSVAQLRSVGDFSKFQINAKLNDFVKISAPIKLKKPKIQIKKYKSQSRFKFTRLFSFLGIVLVLFLLISGIYFNRDGIKNFFVSGLDSIKTSPGGSLENIFLERERNDLINKIRKERTAIFYYSNEEVFQDFNSAKILIKKEKYNDALVLVNKILNSNATFIVKEKTDFLKKYILNIEDREYSNISYQNVLRNPYLYQGFIVKWKGRVANLKRKNGKSTFNLLTEYRKDDIFTGIADVYADKDLAKIKNGDIIEMKAFFNSTLGNDNRIYLIAKEILINKK